MFKQSKCIFAKRICFAEYVAFIIIIDCCYLHQITESLCNNIGSQQRLRYLKNIIYASKGTLYRRYTKINSKMADRAVYGLGFCGFNINSYDVLKPTFNSSKKILDKFKTPKTFSMKNKKLPEYLGLFDGMRGAK